MADGTEHSDDLPTFEELRSLNVEGLRKHYDSVASGDGRKLTHASFYLDEIRRRESAAREKRMLLLTVVIAFLTAVITGWTIVTWHAVNSDKPSHRRHDRPGLRDHDRARLAPLEIPPAPPTR